MNDFSLSIDRKLLKNRENTVMNKKVRLLLGTDFQEFTAQGTKTTCDFRCNQYASEDFDVNRK
jgi:hypothetical protein